VTTKQRAPSDTLWWLATITLTAVVGFVDWLTGHELSIFVLYFLPVGLAAWHLGLASTVIEAVLCAASWYSADALAGHVYSAPIFAVGNTLVRLCAFLAIGWAICRIRTLLISERESSALLRRSLAEIKVLQGILPICAACKKIRDKDDRWIQIERYVSTHSNAEFTHGYCPDCAKALLAEAGLTDLEE
jgi:hypothetical protein